MGYRSEVKSVIYGEPSKVDAFLKEHEAEYNQVKADFGETISIKGSDFRKYIYLDIDYVKWYDEFEDVQRWHDYLHLAEASGLCFEFVRVGESSEGDIEQIYGGDNNLMYLTPTVTIDVGFDYDEHVKDIKDE